MSDRARRILIDDAKDCTEELAKEIGKLKNESSVPSLLVYYDARVAMVRETLLAVMKLDGHVEHT
jgi:hypothetical protein